MTGSLVHNLKSLNSMSYRNYSTISIPICYFGKVCIGMDDIHLLILSSSCIWLLMNCHLGTAEEILFKIPLINITVDILGKKIPIFSKQIDLGLLGNGSAPNSSKAEATYEVTHTGHGAPHRMGEVMYFGGRV